MRHVGQFGCWMGQGPVDPAWFGSKTGQAGQIEFRRHGKTIAQFSLPVAGGWYVHRQCQLVEICILTALDEFTRQAAVLHHVYLEAFWAICGGSYIFNGG